MDRRNFLKPSAVKVGALAAGGGTVHIMTRDSDILDDHFEGTKRPS